MSIKNSTKARIVKNDPNWAGSRIGQEVEVLSTSCPGYANVKVVNSYGEIFYCRPDWLKKPNQADTKEETKAIRKEAEKLTEKRMTEIKKQLEEEKTRMEEIKRGPGRPKKEPEAQTETQTQTEPEKPKFENILKQIEAVFEVCKTEPNDSKNLVAKLAMEQIFKAGKDGWVR